MRAFCKGNGAQTMSDREKLIELISEPIVLQVFCTSDGEPVSRYWCRAVADEDVGVVVDHLIANGVTVQKHGRWIWNENAIDWGLGGWVCSECQEKNDNLPAKPDINPSGWVGSRYCPNCGARMDLKGENE